MKAFSRNVNASLQEIGASVLKLATFADDNICEVVSVS